MSKPEVPIHSLRGFGAFRTIISNGNVVIERPLRLFYLTESGRPGVVSVGFAVTKNLRRAVDRNYIKRLMREAFRLQHSVFKNNGQCDGELKLVIMYAGNKKQKPQMVQLKELSASMHTLLSNISIEITT
jgi:ribonuclease P protein component